MGLSTPLDNFKKSVNTHSSTHGNNAEHFAFDHRSLEGFLSSFCSLAGVRHFRATVDLHHHLPRLLVAIQGFGEYAEHLPMGYIEQITFPTCVA